MSQRAIGLAVAVLGLIVGLLFALADVLGLGGSPGFGRSQVIGVIVGAVILVAGIIIYAKTRAAPSAEPPHAETGGT